MHKTEPQALPVWKPGRLLGRLLAALLAVGLALAVHAADEGDKDKEKDKAKEEEKKRQKQEKLESLPLDQRPTIVLSNFRSQITRAGVKTQEIAAREGRLDEVTNVLDLEGLNVRFYDEGTSKGQANCGAGRVWLKDRPREGVSRHDVLLTSQVTYQTAEGWLLKAPMMKFTQADGLLRSNRGYTKQLPAKRGYYVGSGQAFEIKVRLDKNTFENWTEYGQPVVLKKSKEPVIKP